MQKNAQLCMLKKKRNQHKTILNMLIVSTDTQEWKKPKKDTDAYK